jgi:hypothetical protein
MLLRYSRFQHISPVPQLSRRGARTELVRVFSNEFFEIWGCNVPITTAAAMRPETSAMVSITTNDPLPQSYIWIAFEDIRARRADHSSDTARMFLAWPQTKVSVSISQPRNPISATVEALQGCTESVQRVICDRPIIIKDFPCS